MAMELEDNRILVVDDEAGVRRFLRHALEEAGLKVAEAETGLQALESLRTHHHDLVLLDLCLPDMTGIDLVKVMREWSRVPVVMLSVHDDESDIVEALDAGADDYMRKPMSTPELLARLRSALRRGARDTTEAVFEVGQLRVDTLARLVSVAGESVSLTPTEYDLLKVLIQSPGRVLTHLHLLRAIWGKAAPEDVGVLRVNVCNLRRKLEAKGGGERWILTEPGVGYRLANP